MASEADSPLSPSRAGTRSPAAGVIARQDRIPTWSLSYLLIGIIGVGFLLWLPIAAVLTIIGTIMIAAFASSNFALAAIGSIITFFGFNLWVPMTYAWSAENYPTRARATGFALVDGVGHLGGGVGILFIAPLIPTLLASLGATTGSIVIFVIIDAFPGRGSHHCTIWRSNAAEAIR
jgi:MFS family permease